MRKLISVLVVFATLFVSVQVMAADDGHHPHHIAVGLGTGWQQSKNATFAALDYNYNFDNRYFVGLFFERARGDFDIEAFGVLFGRKWGDGWKALIGPAIETKLKKDKDLLMVRGQLAYEWHSGNWSWGPHATYDLIEDLSDAFYIGFVVGYGF